MASFNVSNLSTLSRFISPQLQATQSTTSTPKFATSLASRVSDRDIASLLPGIFGTGVGSGSAGSASTGSGAATGSASGGGSGSGSGGSTLGPGDVATLVAAIPIADDGDVIYADYHNTLRAAILAIASYLGSGSANQASVETLAPALLDASAGNDTPWDQTPQAATGAGLVFGLGSRDGWLPVDLPDGVKLKSLSVVDQRTASLGSLVVSLGRYSLRDPSADPISLAQISVTGGDDTVKTDTAPISVAGISDPSVIAALGQVDNSSYRYFIRASAAWGKALQTVGGDTIAETSEATATLSATRLENPAVRSFASALPSTALEEILNQTPVEAAKGAAQEGGGSGQATLTSAPASGASASPPEELERRLPFETFVSLYAFQIAYTLW